MKIVQVKLKTFNGSQTKDQIFADTEEGYAKARAFYSRHLKSGNWTGEIKLRTVQE